MKNIHVGILVPIFEHFQWIDMDISSKLATILMQINKKQ